jgi:hypothetical protein
MAAHVTAASVHDFKLFTYFFALFLLFLDIDANRKFVTLISTFFHRVVTFSPDNALWD